MRNLLPSQISQRTQSFWNFLKNHKDTFEKKPIRQNRFPIILGVIYSIGMGLPTSVAHAGDASVDSFTMSVTPAYQYDSIDIISTGGEQYDAISPTTIKLGIQASLRFKRSYGYMDTAGLFIGLCNKIYCGNHPMVGFWQNSDTRTWSMHDEISFSTDRIPFTTENGIDPVGVGDQLIRECNQNTNYDATKPSTFSSQIRFSLSVDTHNQVRRDRYIQGYDDIEDIHFNGGDQSRNANLTVIVNCIASAEQKQPTTAQGLDLQNDKGDMKVNDIKMSLTTYSHAFSEPTPGTKCKKAKLRVTLETNQAGLISFKLWKREAGFVSSEDTILGAHHDDGRFFAIHERWISVDKTTNFEFNARDLVNETFYNETGWKSITLNCSGAGGGGFATPDNDSDQDTPVGSTLTGNFSFIDNSNAAKKNKCERSAKALVWFDSPKSDNIHYSLDCGALGNFSGVLQPTQVSNGKYRAGKLIPFQISQTIEAGCTLRTVSPYSPKDHSFKSKTFQCIKSAGHDSDIGGLTSGGTTRPFGAETRRPLVTSPEKPKPTNKRPVYLAQICKGGKIRYGNCFCPKDTKRIKISRFEYLCKKKSLATPTKPEKPKKPVRINPPKPKKAKLVCIGGKARAGKCKCGLNTLRRKVGKRKFQCIKIAKPTQPKKPLRVNPKSKKKALICKGGKVRGNRCACPKNHVRKKQGKRKFICFRPAG